jgi:hypothetical protein
VAKLAQETNKIPVFAVEGNSPFALSFEFEAYRNKRLSYIFYQAAVGSLKGSELSRKYYQKKLSEGKKPKPALRALAKKLAEIVYAVLKNKEPYDEKRYLN